MRIQVVRSIARLAVVVLLAACATADRMEPLATPDRSAIPPSGPYTSDGRLAPGLPLPGLHFGPSVGTCALPAIAGTVTACCDNRSCNGHCVQEPAGRIECSCFGQRGGCPPGTVCSKLSHRCVASEDRKTP